MAIRAQSRRPFWIAALIFAGGVFALAGFAHGRLLAQAVSDNRNVINIPMALYDPRGQAPSVALSVATTVNISDIDPNSAYLARCAKAGTQQPACDPGDVLVCIGRQIGVLDKPNPNCNKSQTYAQASAAGCLASSWVDCQTTLTAFPNAACAAWTDVGRGPVMGNTALAACFKPASGAVPVQDGPTCVPSKCQGVTCSAIDTCHLPGTCESATGLCSNPNAPDGTKCDDGYPNTLNDQCLQGVCTGTRSCLGVTCYALDQCHKPGTCDPSTAACTNPVVPNGTPCNDGYPSTVNDSCTDGVCYGDPSCNSVSCAPADDCHFAGICDPSSGQCSDNPKPNGTPCNDGYASTVNDRCQSGICQGAFSCQGYQCAPPDQCQFPGVCNASQWGCTYASKPDGTLCNDGNSYTKNDKCTQGYCQGTLTCSAVTCSAQDQCHNPGTCDPSTVTCSNPAKPDGTPCDDGDQSTGQDACSAGVCRGAPLPECKQCIDAPPPTYGPPVTPLKPDKCGDGICGGTEVSFSYSWMGKNQNRKFTTTCAKDCGTPGGNTCPAAYPTCMNSTVANANGGGRGWCGDPSRLGEQLVSGNFPTCSNGQSYCLRCIPEPPYDYSAPENMRACYLLGTPEDIGICCGYDASGNAKCETGSSYCACQVSRTLRDPIFFHEQSDSLKIDTGCMLNCPLARSSQCIENCKEDAQTRRPRSTNDNHLDPLTAACYQRCAPTISPKCAACYLKIAENGGTGPASCSQPQCSPLCGVELPAIDPSARCKGFLPSTSTSLLRQYFPGGTIEPWDVGSFSGLKNMMCEVDPGYFYCPAPPMLGADWYIDDAGAMKDIASVPGPLYTISLPANDPRITPRFVPGRKIYGVYTDPLPGWDPGLIAAMTDTRTGIAQMIWSFMCDGPSAPPRSSAASSARSVTVSSAFASSVVASSRTSSAVSIASSAQSSSAKVSSSAAAVRNAQCEVLVQQTTIEPNRAFLATFLLTNTGNTTWSAGEGNGHDLLMSNEPNDNVLFGPTSMRFALQQDVPPKGTVAVTAILFSPAQTGTKPIVYQMGLEGTARYGQVCRGSIMVTASSSAMSSARTSSASSAAVSSARTSSAASAAASSARASVASSSVASSSARSSVSSLASSLALSSRAASSVLPVLSSSASNLARCPGEIGSILSLAFDGSGNLWFVLPEGNAIGVRSPAGTVTLYTLPRPNSYPGYIALGPDGNMWFTEQSGGAIGRITPAGDIKEFSISSGNGLSPGPAMIVKGPDGNMWFTEQGWHSVAKITMQGVITQYGGFLQPYGIVVGPDQNLWFSEQMGNSIVRMTTAGVSKRFTLLTRAGHLAVGPDGKIWYAGYPGNKIGRIDSAGIVNEYALPAGENSMGIVAAGTSVWFGVTESAKIGKSTVNGTFSWYSLPRNYTPPSSLILGSDGKVWFGELGSGKIGTVDASGAITEYQICNH